MHPRSIRRGRLALLALLLAGCSGDDTAETDAGAQTPDAADAAPPADTAGPHAVFTISATPTTGVFGGGYYDVPQPTMLEEKVRAGDCAFFAPEPPFCDPACPGDAICATGGVCRGFQHGIDVGTVRVTGTNPALSLEPTVFNTYYTDPAVELPGLYQPGDEITMTANGTSQTPGLSLTVRGVRTVVPGSNQLTAREHEDLIVTWDADPSAPPGTAILFHADSDHHGIQAYVECRSEDDGELIVPTAVLDPLIEAGETGIGTYIENAWLARVNQATTETDRGTALFQSESKAWIAIETVRAD